MPLNIINLRLYVVACLCTVVLPTLLTGCDDIGNPRTYPGAIEKRSSEATTTFRSTDEAKRYADDLEKQVVAFSSSDPDISIRKVTFKASNYESGKRGIENPFLVNMNIEYEVSKTANRGDRAVTISGKDVYNAELVSTTLQIRVAGSKAEATASLGLSFLVGGIIGIWIGIAVGKETENPLSWLFVIGGAGGVIYGVWLLLSAPFS